MLKLKEYSIRRPLLQGGVSDQICWWYADWQASLGRVSGLIVENTQRWNNIHRSNTGAIYWIKHLLIKARRVTILDAPKHEIEKTRGAIYWAKQGPRISDDPCTHSRN
jgi:hypothetical protein